MIMLTSPTRKITIMKELKMENQCIWRNGKQSEEDRGQEEERVGKEEVKRGERRGRERDRERGAKQRTHSV